MKCHKKISWYCYLYIIYHLVFGATGFAQEMGSESLRLPEVVITGIEQLRIQRELPKVTLEMPLPVITESMSDRADTLAQEADRLALTQPQQAIKLYLQAILSDPQNSRAYLGLGNAYQASDQNDMAVAAYQKALTETTQYREAHYHLGILFERHEKDLSKAREHYRAYLDLGGIDQRVRIWLRNLEKEEIPLIQEETP